MIDNIYEVITNVDVLLKRCIQRDGFVFTSIGEPSNIYDALIIRNPENAKNEWQLDFSEHSLENHIKLINDFNLEKALVFANDIHFLTRCKSLKEIAIFQSDNDEGCPDFSPLYKLNGIKKLFVETTTDKPHKPETEIDYSEFNELKHLSIAGRGHLNYKQLKKLEYLSISNNKDLLSVNELECKETLKELDLLQCNIKSLSGIGNFSSLQALHLSYNRVLEDISEIEHCFQSLRILSVRNCPRIIDFSFLNKLENLEHLELYGKNELYNLEFLRVMKNLKTFSFSMTVSNNDLTPCLCIPYVNSEKNKKTYNLKNSDLPKEI